MKEWWECIGGGGEGDGDDISDIQRHVREFYSANSVIV